jgi:hypothetical protein
MKPYVEQQTVTTNAEATQFNMLLGKAQLSKISRLLITAQYKYPLSAAIREILSNAYDANTVAAYKDNKKRPVDVTLDVDRVIIRDYGDGLSEESMQTLYTLIGQSTKEEDNNQIGAFGVGRLAPLALNPTFFITSRHQGYKKLYCCFLNEDHIPSLSLWETEESDEESGLEVSIILPEKSTTPRSAMGMFRIILNLTEVSRHTHNYNFTEQVVTLLPALGAPLDFVSYHPHQTIKSKDNSFSLDVYAARRKVMGTHYLDLGGALYPCNADYVPVSSTNNSPMYQSEGYPRHAYYTFNFSDFNIQQGDTTNNFTFVLRLGPDALKLNTSRESILTNEEELRKVQKLYEEIKELLVEEDRKKLHKITYSLASTFTETTSKPEALREAIQQYEADHAAYQDTLYLPEQAVYEYPLPEGDILRVTNESLTPSISKTDNVLTYNVYTYGNVQHLAHSADYYVIQGPQLDLPEDVVAEYNYHLSRNMSVGTYKHKPYCDTSLRLKTCLRLRFNVIESSNTSLTHNQISKRFGEEILKSPVAVIVREIDEPSSLEHLKEYINYWGRLDLESSKKKDQTPKLVAESSVILRQLKYTTPWVIQAARPGFTKISPDIDTLSMDILKEKVIYVVNEDLIDLSAIHYLPDCYFKDYSPYRATISENLYKKLKKLQEKGECNWVRLRDLEGTLCSTLLERYSYLLHVINAEDVYSSLLIMAPYLKNHIPKRVYDLTNWSPKYIEKLRKVIQCCSRFSRYLPQIGSMEPVKGMEHIEVNSVFDVVGSEIKPLLELSAASKWKVDKESIARTAEVYVKGLES